MTPGRRIPTAAAPAAVAGRSDGLWSQNPGRRRPGGGREERCFGLAESPGRGGGREEPRVWGQRLSNPTAGTAAAGRSEECLSHSLAHPLP